MNWSALWQTFTPLVIIALFVGLFLLCWDLVTPGFGGRGWIGIALIVLCSIKIIRCARDESAHILVGIILILGVILFICMRGISKQDGQGDRSCGMSSIAADASLISSHDLNFYIGRCGKSLTDIDPIGQADFDGIRLQVRTAGRAIAEDKTVCITGVQGQLLFVEERSELEYKNDDEWAI